MSYDFSPSGLKVLVVDDDPVCLMILEKMLKQCSYNVTTVNRAEDALSLLKEKVEQFDLVISDVHMPDMDGFKLLELIGLEMDLPVIMMSSNGETSSVLKGITHGACDYLIKPVRIEELKNIWQHVVRRKTSVKEFAGKEHLKNTESKQGDKQLVNQRNESKDSEEEQGSKKRKEKADLGAEQADEALSTKKPRVVWSVELHQRFVTAVNRIGLEKAVPKKILEMMNVQGLTRENVASHLQKYRLYLKRLSGINVSGDMAPGFPGDNSLDLNFGFPFSMAGMGNEAGSREANPFEALTTESTVAGMDLATLAILNQIQALQHKPNPFRDLDDPFGQSSSGSGILQGLSAAELNLLMEAQHRQQRSAELPDANRNSSFQGSVVGAASLLTAFNSNQSIDGLSIPRDFLTQQESRQLALRSAEDVFRVQGRSDPSADELTSPALLSQLLGGQLQKVPFDPNDSSNQFGSHHRFNNP